MIVSLLLLLPGTPPPFSQNIHTLPTNTTLCVLKIVTQLNKQNHALFPMDLPLVLQRINSIKLCTCGGLGKHHL